MKGTIITALLSLTVMAAAQEWTARYNGTGDSLDGAAAIAVDGGGNVYVTGRSMAPNYGYDYVTVKYNSAGSQQWAPRYDGPVSSYDEASDIAIDDSGNVLVTGRSYGVGTFYDYATVKYNAAGSQQWVQRYNGPGNSHDEAKGICVDRFRNVYVTGRTYDATTSEDYTTIKYNAAGDEKWVRRYNGPGGGFDEARAIAVDSAGNVYVTGASYGGSTDVDYATVKYDTAGVELWVRRYNGPANSTDEAVAIAVDRSGNATVTGSSWGSSSYYDYATVKYNAAGTQQWAARYNGTASGPDNAYAITVDTAGNIYVTGRSSGMVDYDYATVKYNPAGSEQWARQYNGPGDSYDEAYAVAVDPPGNAVVTGRSMGLSGGEDYATVKYTAAGTQIWAGRYNGPAGDNDVASAIALDDAGNIYVTGESYGIGSGTDYATLKYAYTVTVDETDISDPVLDTPSIPGIVRDLTGIIKDHPYRVYDITGRETEPVKMTQGIYFLKIGRSAIKKIIIIK